MRVCEAAPPHRGNPRQADQLYWFDSISVEKRCHFPPCDVVDLQNRPSAGMVSSIAVVGLNGLG